jgi:hypothetical protein
MWAGEGAFHQESKLQQIHVASRLGRLGSARVAAPVSQQESVNTSVVLDFCRQAGGSPCHRTQSTRIIANVCRPAVIPFHVRLVTITFGVQSRKKVDSTIQRARPVQNDLSQTASRFVRRYWERSRNPSVRDASAGIASSESAPHVGLATLQGNVAASRRKWRSCAWPSPQE